MVKRFFQKKGIDFDEIFSNVVKMTLVCVMFGLTSSLDLEFEEMDVKIVFLYVDEEYTCHNQKDLRLQERRTLYGN